MSLQQVKVKRAEVFNIVNENKAKHDQLLKEAIEGYWVEAESQLKKLEKDSISTWNKTLNDTIKKLRKDNRTKIKALKDQIGKELEMVKKREKTGYIYMRNVLPEDHGDDYEGTIRRLELIVDDTVELNTNEFDSYVRNKWSWRDSFLTSNTGYAKSFYSNPVSATYGTGSIGRSVEVLSDKLKF
jgi:hypothetical protein